MAKIKLEDIREELKKENWEVISDSYKNLDTDMTFKCPEGHTVISAWKYLRNKRTCPVCKNNYYKEQEEKVIPKKKDTTRILALDQATHITGYSIYDDGKLVKYGIFKTDEDDEIKRDKQLVEWLYSIVNNWKPDCLGFEDIQLQNLGGGSNLYAQSSNGVGIQTFKILAHLQGILMFIANDLGKPYKIISPSTWRNHCGVKGKSKSDRKRSMQIKVKEWYDISVSNDEADAIGIGKYLSDTYRKEVEIFSWE